MIVKNESTGKRYPVTKEHYEKFLKGKENFTLISDADELEPSVSIGNDAPNVSIKNSLEKKPAVSKEDQVIAEKINTGKKSNKRLTNKNKHESS